MKNRFAYDTFKHFCYQVEGLLNREWTVQEMSGVRNTYSFYFAIFQSAGCVPQKLAVVCNNQKPIFALVDLQNVNTGNCEIIDRDFIENEAIENALQKVLELTGLNFSILKPEVLNIVFSSAKELAAKLVEIGRKKPEVQIVVDLVWASGSVGYGLFNYEED